MNAKELPVVKEVSTALKSLYKDRLSKIILYGSFARGDQHEESDIDFLVILKDEQVSPFKEIDYFNEPMRRLSDKYKVEISIKAAGCHFMEKENSLFVELVKEEGIAVA